MTDDQRWAQWNVIDHSVLVHIIVDDATDLDQTITLRLNDRIGLDNDERGQESAINTAARFNLIGSNDATSFFRFLRADGQT